MLGESPKMGTNFIEALRTTLRGLIFCCILLLQVEPNGYDESTLN